MKKPKFIKCDNCRGKGQTPSKRTIVSPKGEISRTIFVQCRCCGGTGQLLEKKS